MAKNEKSFKTENGTVELLPLWANWANEFRELFKQDPEIKMSLNEKTHTITMVVNNYIKYLALKDLLPTEKKCNEITVKIDIKLPANRKGGPKYKPEVVAEAFKGNPIFQYIHCWEPADSNVPFAWCTLNTEPIQWPADDLHNLWSYKVKLPEDIARNILEEFTDYVYYCSKVEGKEIVPEGEESYNLPKDIK